jgi:hypothetical protein
LCLRLRLHDDLVHMKVPTSALMDLVRYTLDRTI